MKYQYVLTLLLIFTACNGQQKPKEKEATVSPRKFEMVSVPALITDPGERAAYLAKHFWDKFDFKDTTNLHVPEVTEQALSDFIGIVGYTSSEVTSSSIKSLMKKAEADSTVFRYFSDQLEKYLYDPNSPLRNEEMYIPVLEYLVEASSLSDVDKIRPAHLLELALRNRKGTPAADFTYTLANGQTGKLYGLKADYLLLFFYNPDCHACQEITQQLSSSQVIKELEKRKKLNVLAVYTDEDLQAWKNHLSAMPSDWINSYDKSLSLKNNEVYDLKAIPTLYLLNKEKKILLKDATFEQVESYLSQYLTN